MVLYIYDTLGSTYIEFDYKHYYGKEGESVVIGLHASQPIIRKFRVAVSVSKFKRTDTHSRAEALSGMDLYIQLYVHFSLYILITI